MRDELLVLFELLSHLFELLSQIANILSVALDKRLFVDQISFHLIKLVLVRFNEILNNR